MRGAQIHTCGGTDAGKDLVYIMKKRILSLILTAVMLFTTLAFELPAEVGAATWGDYNAAAWDMGYDYAYGTSTGLIYNRFNWGNSQHSSGISVSRNGDYARLKVNSTVAVPYTCMPMSFSKGLNRTSYDSYVMVIYNLPSNSKITGLRIRCSSSNATSSFNYNFTTTSYFDCTSLTANGDDHIALFNISSASGTAPFNLNYLSIFRLDLLSKSGLSEGQYVDIKAVVFSDSLQNVYDYADDKNLSMAHCTYEAYYNGSLYATSASYRDYLEYSFITPSAPSKAGHSFNGFTITVNNVTFDSGDSVSYNVGANQEFTFSGVSPVDLDADKVDDNQHMNVTITPTWTVNKYTVRWYNGSTLLETDTSVPYNTTPTYNSSTPTKASTAQYDYTFSGWSPAVGNITGDTDYYAQFSSTIRKYTVTWKNHDGATLETDTGVAYGTTPTYNGSTPTKAADAQYTYTFKGWDKEISPVTGDTTYTATYTPIPRSYSITWKNWDGTVLDTDPYQYGSTPSYDGNTPTRPATPEYSYVFAGWDPTVSAVTGEAIYTAKFDSVKNRYTVTFLDEDGTTVLKTEEFDYGTNPTPPANPSKSNALGYSYTFNGWDKEISSVVGNATYKATYTKAPITYTITYNFADGNAVAGYTTTYTVEQPITLPVPTKNGFVFNGWTVTNGTDTWENVTDIPLGTTTFVVGEYGDVTLTANWIEKLITITYAVIGNGSVSPQSETIAMVGGTPEGSTATPNANHMFVGWFTDADCTGEAVSTDLNFVPTNGGTDATYYAKFELAIADLVITIDGTEEMDDGQAYIITVKNSDGSLVLPIAVRDSISDDEPTTVTVKDLPVGTYTVSNDDNWSWSYDVGINGTGASSARVELTAEASNHGNSADFNTSRPAIRRWLGGDAYCSNKYGKKENNSN